MTPSKELKEGDFIYVDQGFGGHSSWEIFYLQGVTEYEYHFICVDSWYQLALIGDGIDIRVGAEYMDDFLDYLNAEILPRAKATIKQNLCKCPLFELINLGCKCGGK